MNIYGNHYAEEDKDRFLEIKEKYDISLSSLNFKFTQNNRFPSPGRDEKLDYIDAPIRALKPPVQFKIQKRTSKISNMSIKRADD